MPLIENGSFIIDGAGLTSEGPLADTDLIAASLRERPIPVAARPAELVATDARNSNSHTVLDSRLLGSRALAGALFVYEQGVATLHLNTVPPLAVHGVLARFPPAKRDPSLQPRQLVFVSEAKAKHLSEPVLDRYRV